MRQTEFARIMANLVDRREMFVVATVVKIEGSSLGKPGFKVIISKDGGVVYGSLGGVCPESAVASAAQRTLQTEQPKTVKVFLESVEGAVEGMLKSQTEDEIYVETNCGGTMEIYMEPYLPQQRLVLVGQGGKDDVEDALVRLGKGLDFEVVVFDHSPVLTEAPDLLVRDPAIDLSKFKFFDSDSVVVLTKGARDMETLTALSQHKLRYIGMMASRQRARATVEGLLAAGASKAFVEALHSPIGVDIGSVGPEEIALSILAEVVATKHGRTLPSMALGTNNCVEVTRG